MRERPQKQDWLTAVVELDLSGNSARVTGAMIDYTSTSPNALLETRSHPDVRIVSLTITKGGYFLDADGAFDSTHRDIVHDSRSSETPRTVFGILVAAIAKRKVAGRAPFMVLSCDNVPSNVQSRLTTDRRTNGRLCR